MVHSEWLLKEKETAEQFISYFKIEHSEVCFVDW
jgi:hypothetical protein